jgi:lipopolysaccharide export system protein LptA
MKRIAYSAALIAIAAFAAIAQQLPTLKGDQAINRLKQDDQYDSLIKAVDSARAQSERFGPSTDIIAEWTKVDPSDTSSSDDLAISVAVSGDTAVVGSAQSEVGSNTDQGWVFVMVRSGTTWTQQQVLTASDGAPFDRFGSKVLISGDTLFVTAGGDDSSRGSVYVYQRIGTTWVQQPKILAPDGVSLDIFGTDISLSGDTLVVGASGDSGPLTGQGSAYVFVRSGTTWLFQQRLVASDAEQNAAFGSQVAISGETISISAPRDDVGTNIDQGSAYAFVRSGTTWTQQQKLDAPEGTTTKFFGNAIAISGDTIVVGAPRYTVGGNVAEGAAFVFARTGTVWNNVQQLTASDGTAGDVFGGTVVLSGDTLLISASEQEVDGDANQGSTFVFTRTGNVWTEVRKLNSSDTTATTFFGRAIAIDGDTIMIGALNTAYIYRALSNDWIEESHRLGDDGAASDNFGYSVAISGKTAVVGAPYDNVGPAGPDQGSVYVFEHSGSGWNQVAHLIPPEWEAGSNDYFGYSVAISGNYLVIGAPGDDSDTNVDQGSVYFFERLQSGWTERRKVIPNSENAGAGDRFGSSVAITTESGRAIVGAPGDDVGSNVDQGSAYIISNSNNWGAQWRIVASDGEAGDGFGGSVGIFYTTAVVGANADNIGGNDDQGSAYVFAFPGFDPPTEVQKLTAPDGAAGDQFGSSVAFWNKTIIAGAPLDDENANADQGSAHIFTTNGTTFSHTTKLLAADGAAGDQFGKSVSVNVDLISVGASLDDVGGNVDQGSAYVFGRSSGTWSQLDKISATGGSAGDKLGTSVSISGEKCIAGAPFSDITASDEGTAFFFVDFVSQVPEPSHRVAFDFDGDGKTDVGIFRPSVGEWWIFRSSTNSTFAAQFGASTDEIVPADYTGDGKTDIAIWRPSTGEWFVVRSEDGSFYSGPFGGAGDIPVPADYDGDGKADIAVFRPATGYWFVQRSSDGQTTAQLFGQNGDQPVAADYDGDGLADVAIYRPSVGQWWLYRTTAGVIAYEFGNSTDKLVPGDYTGDGKTDVAFWRPSSGEWFILRSENTTYFSAPFGTSGDLPSPGDYDGDGRFDVTVFRPSNGVWYIQRTTAGTLSQLFGTAGDQPLANASVP